MTRWWQSAGELREFHVDRDGTSLAECLTLLAPNEGRTAEARMII
jgi:hypothetical protein